ncbi:NUDIX domain-containing protein [Clostridium sp. UBA4548]|uniref:NUDIX domain-containing protein n=1 Tax=Clostridium sp. UBA4548 TaxID=1946361 RepID=UPI0025C20255|nr:NUDIX domain-containing protein [Clostridium sp. UBA4548]
MIKLNTFGKEIKGDFRERNRAAGIVLNGKKEIILMNLTNMYFHMLPGGGMDGNENMEEALYRELKEETGANVQIISELGIVVENLEQRKMKQITYFYLTKVVGEIQEPNFMPDELEQGYQVEWYSIDDAIKILEEENEYEEYIKQRELDAIKEAKKYLQENDL